MSNIIEGYRRVYHSTGMFDHWNRDLGLKRVAIGALKALDLATVPFSPNGTHLERLRLGLIGEGNLSPNNIVRKIFEIESEMYTPEQVSQANEILSRIIIRAKNDLLETMTPQEKLTTVYRAIEKKGLEFEVQKDQLFIGCLLGGKLDCDASSFVVLGVAQEFNWPISLVAVPGHVFIRWHDSEVSFNIDIGRIHPDNYYFQEYDITKMSFLDQKGIIALTFSNRGVAKFRLGNYEEAILDFNEAITLNSRCAMAFYNRGTAKSEMDCFKEAILDFDEAIRLNPKNAESFNNRGTANAKLGNYEEALLDYNEAIRLAPEFSEAFQNRGSTQYLLGRLEEAFVDFNEAIRLDPNNSIALHHLELVKHNLGL